MPLTSQVPPTDEPRVGLDPDRHMSDGYPIPLHTSIDTTVAVMPSIESNIDEGFDYGPLSPPDGIPFSFTGGGQDIWEQDDTAHSTAASISVANRVSQMATPPTFQLNHYSPTSRLPFHLSRATSDSALAIQSLKDLTARLLLGRQNARMSDFNKLWTIELNRALADEISYHAKFDDQMIPGLQLTPLEAETNVNISYKICAFGCTNNGKHQHLCNIEYVSLFSARLTSAINGSIKVLQENLSLNVPTFLGHCLHQRWRTFSDLGILMNWGVLESTSSTFTIEIILLTIRMTDQQTGHLTALSSIGMALLYYAIEHLGIKEMEDWRKFEKGNSKVDVGQFHHFRA